MKKLIAVVLSILIASSILLLAPMTVSAYAEADFNGWTELGGGTAGKALSGNYKVTANTTITNSTAGGNGITINGTVRIYVAGGATLTVAGANGNANTGGGAGIFLPSGQTLYLYGAGTVNATGGAGYQGGGGNAGGAYGESGTEPGWYYGLTFTTGSGGAGGRGGSSPGAGVGAAGAAGGAGGTGGTGKQMKQDGGVSYAAFTKLNGKGGGDASGITAGNSGNNGSGGAAGTGMGTLYVLDRITLSAAAGARSATSGSGGSSGRSKGYAGWDSGLNKGGTFTVASGGGGGGGGYAGTSANIGGSGGGGGGGGGGSSGSFFFEYLWGGRVWDAYFFTGNGGGGGGGNGSCGAYGTAYDAVLHNNEPLIVTYRNGTSANGAPVGGGAGGVYNDYYVSAKGGNGGARGTGGAGGTVYKAPSATVTAPSGGSASGGDGAAAAVTAYAQTYTVTLNNQSATTAGTPSVSAGYGSAMPTITPPTRTGYAFGGYYAAVNGTGAQYYTPAGTSAQNFDQIVDDTLYAAWAANTYLVTLDDQGATVPGTSSVTATYGGAMPGIAALPAKTGYSFGGYFTEPDGGGTQYYTANGESAIPYSLTSNSALYAKWTPSAYYTVTLDNQSATTSGTASVTAAYGGAMPDITAPSKTGHAFGGYFTGVGGGGTQYYTEAGTSANVYNLQSAATLYANWTPRAYTITLNSQGATAEGALSAIAAYGSSLPSVGVPAKTGYAFSGYYTGPNGSGAKYYDAQGVGLANWDIADNTTLFAFWTRTTYTVTQVLENVTGSDGAGIAAPGIDYAVTLTAAPGHEFSDAKPVYVYIAGARQDDLTIAFTEPTDTASLTVPGGRITGNIVISAEANLIFHTITYVMNGAVMEDLNVPEIFSELYGEPNLPSAVSKTGYLFEGWYLTADFQGDAVSGIPAGTATGVTLCAKLTPVSATVTFDPQGGEGGTAQTTGTFDEPLPGIAFPAKRGYDFAGYFSAVGGGGTQYYAADGTSLANCGFLGNTTLYAHWIFVVKNDVSGHITFTDNQKTYTGLSQAIATASVGGISAGNDPLWTYTYAGTGATSYAPSTAPPTNSGTYTVTARYEDSANEGTATAALRIDRAILSVTDITVAAKTYDATATAAVTSAAFSGLQNGETLVQGTDYTVLSASFNSPDAGTDKTVSGVIALFLNAKTDNYVLSSDTFAIGGKAIARLDISGITVTAQFAALTYSGAAQAPDPLSVTFGGAAAAKGADFSIGTYSDNIAAGTGNAVIGGIGNYTGTKSVSFAIGKKDITLVADDKTVVIGGSEPAYTYSVSGLAGSDTKAIAITAAPSLSVAAYDSSAPNTFTINVTGGTASDNYNIAGRTAGTLTVTAKTPTTVNVAAPDAGLVYGDTLGAPRATADAGNGAFAYSYAGTLADEHNTVYGPTDAKPSEPGSYTVTATYNDPIYVGSGSAAFVISAKQLRWNRDGAVCDKAFDGSTAATVLAQPTVNGIVGGDAVTAAGGAVAFAGADAGAAAVAAGYGVEGADIWKYIPPVGQPAFAGRIIKAAGAAVAGTATVGRKTYNSVTLAAGALSGYTGQTVEYAAGTSGSIAPATGWTADLTITGLSASTTYFIWTRSAESANYNAGMPQVNATAFQTDRTPANVHTVTFNANGGSVAPASSTTGVDGKLAGLPVPTRSGGYSFKGWFTAADGGTQVTTNDVFTTNATVYAHWAQTDNVPGGGTDTAASGGAPAVPQTGDGVNLWLCVVGMALSAVCAGWLCNKKHVHSGRA